MTTKPKTKSWSERFDEECRTPVDDDGFLFPDGSLYKEAIKLSFRQELLRVLESLRMELIKVSHYQEKEGGWVGDLYYNAEEVEELINKKISELKKEIG